MAHIFLKVTAFHIGFIYRYREAGKEVIDVLCSFGVRVERASIDEAYLDLTSVIKQMQLTGPSGNTIDCCFT